MHTTERWTDRYVYTLHTALRGHAGRHVSFTFDGPSIATFDTNDAPNIVRASAFDATVHPHVHMAGRARCRTPTPRRDPRDTLKDG